MMIKKKDFMRHYNRYSIIFLRNQMNILLEDFNAKVKGENILKPTIGNDNLDQIVMAILLT